MLQTQIFDFLLLVNSDFEPTTFNFTANTHGLSQWDFRCVKIKNVCYISGIFTPNQAGTPLNLGSFPLWPKYPVNFNISCYNKVASYGTVGTDGIFACNISGVMIESYCVVSFSYIIE